MTYDDIYEIVNTLGHPSCAVKWKTSKAIPDIFIRYYLVSNNTFTNYNEDEIELLQARYTFVVYDQKGIYFEDIFEALKALIENKYGFSTFENITDIYNEETGHNGRQGDIFYYQRKE